VIWIWILEQAGSTLAHNWFSQSRPFAHFFINISHMANMDWQVLATLDAPRVLCAFFWRKTSVLDLLDLAMLQ
jgi:hypothetical protein